MDVLINNDVWLPEGESSFKGLYQVCVAPSNDRIEADRLLRSKEGLEDDLVKDFNVAVSSHPLGSRIGTDLGLSRRKFQVNVLGVVHAINAFIPLLRAGKTKKVITLSSGLSDLSLILKGELITASAYSISKAGVNILNAKYAIEFKDEGFIFLAICPGVVNTDTNPGE